MKMPTVQLRDQTVGDLLPNTKGTTLLATVEGTCVMCPDPVLIGAQIVPKNDGWMHRSCAPGQDDVQRAPARSKPRAKPKAQTSNMLEVLGRVEAAASNMLETREAPAAEPALPAEEAATTAGELVTVIPENPDGMVIRDLDEDTYHAHPTSLSSTGAKTILVAPALFDHERRNPVTKRVYDFGSLAHKEVLGVGPKVVYVQKVDRKGVKCDAGDYMTKSAQEHAVEIRQSGALPMLRKEHDIVRAMAAKLTEHPLAMRLLAKGESEVSGFAIDKESGVLRRGRTDVLRKRVIVDYKTSVTADPKALRKVAHSNGWYMQAPFYVDLFRDLGWDIEHFYFIAQMKTAPYLVSVVELDQDSMGYGRLRNALALDLFRECTETGLWPGFPTEEKPATIRIPDWTLR